MISTIKIIICFPFNTIYKFVKMIDDTMSAFSNILEDIGDIGTIPHELEEYYDEMERRRSRIEYNADNMRAWGCVVGPFHEMVLPLPKECPISHNTFYDDTMIVITECAHVFGYDALREWFGHSRTCPLCRKRMVV